MGIFTVFGIAVLVALSYRLPPQLVYMMAMLGGGRGAEPAVRESTKEDAIQSLDSRMFYKGQKQSLGRSSLLL